MDGEQSALPRPELLDKLATRIVQIRSDRPVLVGIDGRSTAGKSTIARELEAIVAQRGRPVIHASIDDFHRPGHKHRSQRDEWTPESYYAEGFDYQAFRDLLLTPLGPTGNRRYRSALFDSFHDRFYPEEWRVAPNDAIAIIDAAFLMRPVLADAWDLVIWVDIDFESMIERACNRDIAWVNDVDLIARRYRTHWIPTHELYERLERPIERADIVIDNRDVDAPRLLRF